MSRPDQERLGDIQAAFDTAHSIVRATGANDVPALADAVAGMLDRRGPTP